MLNECDLSLTYLNVYKKNHLKLLINNETQSETSGSVVSDNQQLYEEALQARAK